VLREPAYLAKLSQGITTVVTGNCGISLAPAPSGMRSPVPVPLDLMDDEGGWFRFRTFGDYVAALRAAPSAVNCALLVGHSMLRLQAMDKVERPASPPEIRRMRELRVRAHLVTRFLIRASELVPHLGAVRRSLQRVAIFDDRFLELLLLRIRVPAGHVLTRGRLRIGGAGGSPEDGDRSQSVQDDPHQQSSAG